MSTKDLVAVSLDNETLARIDAIRALLDTEWREATRSDVLRLLLLSDLEHFEKKHAAELGVTPRRGRRGAKAPAMPVKRSRTNSPPPAA